MRVQVWGYISQLATRVLQSVRQVRLPRWRVLRSLLLCELPASRLRTLRSASYDERGRILAQGTRHLKDAGPLSGTLRRGEERDSRV